MRALALDIGDKTIGVAASDLLGITAQGVETIRRTSDKNDLQRLGSLVKNFEATTFVIGLPKNMDGTEGARCEAVKKFDRGRCQPSQTQKSYRQDGRRLHFARLAGFN